MLLCACPDVAKADPASMCFVYDGRTQAYRQNAQATNGHTFGMACTATCVQRDWLERCRWMNDLCDIVEVFELDVRDGVQAIDAATMMDKYDPGVNVSWPLIITGLAPESLDSLRATLLNAYPANHEVHVTWSDLSGRRIKRQLAIADLDALKPTTDAALYVPALPPGSDFTDLLQVIAHLRSPIGCPWDREQTLASLRHDLLSEAVEVMEAIDLDSADFDNGSHITEELGDVLLIVTMLVQIAADEGRFQMADVMREIVGKLIRRHPHVFGDVTVNGSDDVVVHWDAIKQQEKADKGQVVDSPLDGVPIYLPALEKARELQSKAAKAGLLDRSALAHSLPALDALMGDELTEDSLGELLWVLTALAKEHDVVAENALRRYAVRYRQQVENELVDASG